MGTSANPTFNSGSVFAGVGRHLLVDGATFNSNFGFNNNLQFDGGFFNGAAPGGVTLDSNLLWTSGRLTGTWTNAASRTLTTSGTVGKTFAGTFTNEGIVAQSDGPLSLGVANVINAGTWNLQGDVGIVIAAGTVGNTFTNTGTLAKTAGTGTSSIGGGVAFDNTGLIDVRTGTVKVGSNFTNQGIINVESGTTFADSASTFVNGTSGLLQGNGTYDPSASNDLVNQGTIAPGKGGIGTLTIAGDFAQASTGVLDFEIGGVTSNLDTLDITGNATFAGTLKVRQFGGFNPLVGDIYTLILFEGTGTGTFASLDTSAFSGLNFAAVYNAHDVQLKVISAVPVPAAVWLFGSALAAMISVNRRRGLVS